MSFFLITWLRWPDTRCKMGSIMKCCRNRFTANLQKEPITVKSENMPVFQSSVFIHSNKTLEVLIFRKYILGKKIQVCVIDYNTTNSKMLD